MKKIFFFTLLLCLSGCAAGTGSSGIALAPRSAQFDVSLDWQYPLATQGIKAFGATPLDLGHVKSVNDITYVTTTLGKVVAINNASAAAIWSQDFGMPVTAGPVIDGNALYIALSSGTILRLNSKTGETVWKYDSGVAVENGLSVSNNIVAFVNANNRAFALDAESGTLKWRRERPRSQEFSMYGQCAPLIDPTNNTIYAGFSDGYLVAYAASNGTAIWSRELAPNARFKDLDVTPLRVGNILYVATSSGGIYALSADDGHTLWQKDIFGISSIRAFQDSLYLSSQSGIFRLRSSDGATIWQNVIQKDALISPIELGKSSIYASVQRYGIVILNRKDGKLEHVLDMGSDFTSAPHMTPGALTALSNNSTVYRFIIEDTPVM